jgi:hypothetical protein
MIYVISIPVVLVLVLLVWVVANMLRTRRDNDRPSTAQTSPRAPASELSDREEVHP